MRQFHGHQMGMNPTSGCYTQIIISIGSRKPTLRLPLDRAAMLKEES